MDYEQLATLLGAYYHEDFEGIWETFDLYTRDASIDEMTELGHELTDFLASTPLDAVRAETRRLGSLVWLGEDPEPYVRWLEGIRDRSEALVRAAKSA